MPRRRRAASSSDGGSSSSSTQRRYRAASGSDRSSVSGSESHASSPLPSRRHRYVSSSTRSRGVRDSDSDSGSPLKQYVAASLSHSTRSRSVSSDGSESNPRWAAVSSARSSPVIHNSLAHTFDSASESVTPIPAPAGTPVGADDVDSDGSGTVRIAPGSTGSGSFDLPAAQESFDGVSVVHVMERKSSITTLSERSRADDAAPPPPEDRSVHTPLGSMRFGHSGQGRRLVMSAGAYVDGRGVGSPTAGVPPQGSTGGGPETTGDGRSFFSVSDASFSGMGGGDAGAAAAAQSAVPSIAETRSVNISPLSACLDLDAFGAATPPAVPPGQALPPPARSEVSVWGPVPGVVGGADAEQAKPPAERVLKTPPRGQLGVRRPRHSGGGHAHARGPQNPAPAAKKPPPPRKAGEVDIFEKMYRKAKERQEALRERERQEREGGGTDARKQQGTGAKGAKPPAPAVDPDEAVRKQYTRISKKAQDTLLGWVAAIVPGAEVRAVRRGQALTAHPEKVWVEEGATGTVLSRARRPRVPPSATITIDETYPLKVALSSGQVRESTVLLTTDYDAPRPCSVMVWVAIGCTPMLVRAEHLSVVASTHAELERRDATGPVLIGRQQVRGAAPETTEEGVARPAWDVLSKPVGARAVSALEKMFPAGCVVAVKGVDEACKVTGYKEGRVVVLVPSTYTLRAVDPRSLERKKNQLYALQVQQAADYTAAQLDEIKERSQRRVAETHQRAAAKGKERDTDKGARAEARKTLDKERADKMVARLTQPLKCRDVSWTAGEKTRRQRESTAKIEREKRAANPTYNAMVQWREEWDKTNTELYSDLASSCVADDDCYEESTAEAEDLYATYWDRVR